MRKILELSQRFLINSRFTRPILFLVISLLNKAEQKRQKMEPTALSERLFLTLEKYGYLKLPMDEFDGINSANILRKLNVYCNNELVDIKHSLNEDDRPVYGLNFNSESHLYSLCPELSELLTHPDLISATSKYLSEVPILAGFTIWHSPKGIKNPTSSQLFHLDHESNRQLKLFVYLHNMTEAHGPMNIIELEKSSELIKKYKISHSKRLNFGNIETELLEKSVPMTGQKGDVLLVDTSRLIHMGARNEKSDRNIFLCQFLPSAAIIIKEKINLSFPKRATFQRLQQKIDNSFEI